MSVRRDRTLLASLVLVILCLLLAPPSCVFCTARELGSSSSRVLRLRGQDRSLSDRVQAMVRRQPAADEPPADPPHAVEVAPVPSAKNVNVEVANVSVPMWALPNATSDEGGNVTKGDDIVCAWRETATDCLANAVCAWWQQRPTTTCNNKKERCGTCHQWNLYMKGDVHECRQYEALVEKKVFNEVEWGSYCGSYFGFKCDVICPGDFPNATQGVIINPLTLGTPEGRLAKMRQDLQKDCEDHDWLISGCERDPSGVLLKSTAPEITVVTK